MTDLSAKAATADAMFRAGNYSRAKDLCREVLQKDDSNFDAFATLIDIRFATEDMARARALCDWRLERYPECVDTQIVHLMVQGRIGDKRNGKKMIMSLRERLGNYPYALQRAELIYAFHFSSRRRFRKLLKSTRDSGMFDPAWLDGMEADNRNDSGHIFATYRLSKKALEDNPDDADELYRISVLSVLTGRLLPAIRYARRGKRLDPAQAPAFNEVILVSYISLCPLFWGGQLFIMIVACLTTRVFWLLRIPLNIIAILFSLAMSAMIAMPLEFISADLAESVGSILIVANLVWLLYLLHGFQRVGLAFSGRKKDVRLSGDY